MPLFTAIRVRRGRLLLLRFQSIVYLVAGDLRPIFQQEVLIKMGGDTRALCLFGFEGIKMVMVGGSYQTGIARAQLGCGQVRYTPSLTPHPGS